MHTTLLQRTVQIERQGCVLTGEIHGAGLPVLLIQGVGVHGSGWRPQVDGLAEHCSCLTFDNRGIGASQPLKGALTVEQMAEDALALMQVRGWKSAHVVGHSLGGLVALHFALTFRLQVRSLALLCTFARGRDATRPSFWMLWTSLRTRVGTRGQRRRAFLNLVLPPRALALTDLDARAAQMAPLFGHDLADQPSVAWKQLSAMRRYDATARLMELAELPTLVVSAQHDRIARPEFGRDLAQRIPGAAYFEMPDAAHGMTIDQADIINDLLLNHLQKVESKRRNGGE